MPLNKQSWIHDTETSAELSTSTCTLYKQQKSLLGRNLNWSSHRSVFLSFYFIAFLLLNSLWVHYCHLLAVIAHYTRSQLKRSTKCIFKPSHFNYFTCKFYAIVLPMSAKTCWALILTASSSLSTLLVWDSLMFPVPSSPEAENLTPSLAQEIMTASPICERSRQMRANSPEGIFTTQLYSCSWRDRQTWKG